MTSNDPYGSDTGRTSRQVSGDAGTRTHWRGEPVPPREPAMRVPVQSARQSSSRYSTAGYSTAGYSAAGYSNSDYSNSDYSTETRGATERQGADATSRGLSRSTLWEDMDRGESRFSGPQPLRARWDPVPPPRSRVGRQRARTQRRRSSFGWFMHHYGWRAYALPVLAALTVMAVVGLVNTAAPTEAAAPGKSGVVTVTMANSVVTTVTIAGPGGTTTVGVAPPPTTAPGADGGSETDANPAAAFANARAAATIPPTPSINAADAFEGVVMGVLPPGAAFAQTGAGTFHVVPGTSLPFGTGPDHRTFTVESEDGVESVAADKEFADAVVTILSGPHSWTATGRFTLQRIDSGTPDFRITLTSQMTTRQAGNCGWEVQLEASCFNSAQGRVLINDARWARGAYAYDGDLASYRVYAINHEVGHALGYNHEPCPDQGGLAPVMMQQSWSTSDNDVALLNGGGPVPADGKVCRANPFVAVN